MMKRIIAILLALLMVLSLAACGGSKENVFDRVVEITSGNLVEHMVIDTDIFPDQEVIYFFIIGSL